VAMLQLSSCLARWAASRRREGEAVAAEVDAGQAQEVVGEVVDDALSKSSPPRWVSPAVEQHLEDAVVSSSSETSKVPPPRS
jgi:hypothetical protein